MLTSVPIGLPITNCNVQLIGENSALNEGELYVGGSCIFRGYYNESDGFVKLPQGYGCEDIDDACQSQLYFKTGDLVKQLPTGDFIFLGREDRIVKIHGQRTALEEVENFLREYPYINDAAVVCRNLQAELVLIEAFIILKDKQQLGESLVPAIRSWLSNKLPSVVLPDRFIFIESFPVSSSGKINYESLVISALLTKTVKDKIGNISCSDLLQLIKKLFPFPSCPLCQSGKVLLQPESFQFAAWSSIRVPVFLGHHIYVAFMLTLNSLQISIYARSVIYVASTGGRITAVSISASPISILWLLELEVPVFGSLAVTQNGTVICGLVDGHVLALDPNGSIVWKKTTGGPIFAGPCIPDLLFLMRCLYAAEMEEFTHSNW
ncbi:hypothetical protein TSUD_301020 [Trifolium subterraneum]|uniref:AMP-binding enzyme C-terminal domain-containing protein n=1 Tax=Trifolium subterraneum TaxID=3900 RepID=A0A2Z6NF55_TRISU|nr:hypothetical protein TSUD_301020 [Trifolium subterraneum]